MSGRKRIHVLLVEDNADDATSLKMLLESRPEVEFTCEWAATVSSAETRLQRGGIDAAIVDLTMPDGCGQEVVDRVKAAGPDIGTIVHTGWTDPDVSGVDHVLTKPTPGDEISRKLQFTVIHRNALREKEEFRRILSEIGETVEEMDTVFREAVDGDGPELP